MSHQETRDQWNNQSHLRRRAGARHGRPWPPSRDRGGRPDPLVFRGRSPPVGSRLGSSPTTNTHGSRRRRRWSSAPCTRPPRRGSQAAVIARMPSASAPSCSRGSGAGRLEPARDYSAAVRRTDPPEHKSVDRRAAGMSRQGGVRVPTQSDRPLGLDAVKAAFDPRGGRIRRHRPSAARPSPSPAGAANPGGSRRLPGTCCGVEGDCDRRRRARAPVNHVRRHPR